jgi:uncharacterized protein YbjT (DUF2867 family)
MRALSAPAPRPSEVAPPKPWRIAVFGSTGGNGRLILAEALRRGHRVTAFARQASALAGVAGIASVVIGDAANPEPVSSAIAGQEAVIMTVTASAAITRTVTDAMRSLAVARLVATSAYGLVATRPYVLASIIRRVLAKTYAEQLAADRIIQATGLDWTIVRATRLTNGRSIQSSRLSTALFTSGPFSITRASYARALLDIAEADRYVKQIVNITGSGRYHPVKQTSLS